MKPKKNDKPLRGRPPKGPTKRLSVDIKPELRDYIDELVERDGRLLNATVERVIEWHRQNEPK